MLTNGIRRLSSYLKGRKVEIDNRVPNVYLISLALRKVSMLCRGLIKTGRLIYVGKHSQIRATALLRIKKGVEIGDYCLVDCCSLEGVTLGQGTKIGHFCLINVSGSLSDLGAKIIVGDNVGIGDFAHIGGAGGVTIGSNTITGAYLSIHPENHNFLDPSELIRKQGVSRRGISIGEDCWIGAKATFLDGSSIGNGCIVAAGAVVTKKFEDNLVVGGVPARVLSERPKQ